ncbi:proteoglycan 4-like [Poecile atricapillus]|uniref:proteoglycan 4-like n=1 Tax=Poecile atricapillus TaxID=48891 RepID=UPI0027387E4D|nr:proteoglycan 4-like [Poecile atricapillus]
MSRCFGSCDKGSLRRQEQGKTLNYLSAPGSVCWEANQGRGGVYLGHIPGAVRHRFPSEDRSGSRCPHRRLEAIQARIPGQPSPALPRKRPSGVGDTVAEGRDAAPSRSSAAGRAWHCPVTRRDGLCFPPPCQCLTGPEEVRHGRGHPEQTSPHSPAAAAPSTPGKPHLTARQPRPRARPGHGPEHPGQTSPHGPAAAAPSSSWARPGTPRANLTSQPGSRGPELGPELVLGTTGDTPGKPHLTARQPRPRAPRASLTSQPGSRGHELVLGTAAGEGSGRQGKI